MVCRPDTPQRRLLFLTVNSSYSHSSLALPLLHSACRDLTHWQWLRCDMTNDSDIMSAVREIYSHRCDLLATDLYLFNRKTALEVLQRYHALDPACRIVVGGPECLGEGAVELLRQYPYLDCLFRGEGENIFREYLEHFDDPEFAPGRIVPSDGNAVYTNWNNAPYPVCDLFFTTGKPFVQIETSRGCPMHCLYCTSGNTHTRYRSLEQVREELTLLHRKNVREVRVLDRTFNLPQERGAALLKMFREEFPDMRFHLELHPQFLNDSLRSELQQARPGQLHIEVGIQCLDPVVQQFSGRGSQRDKVLAGLNFLCSQNAFETHADLLAGLPGQRWSHILDDCAVLMQTHAAEIQLEVLKALPGTPLRQAAAEHGLCFAADTPYDVMQSNTMSMSEIQHARDLSRLLDISYNHAYLHPVILIMQNECANFVSRFLKFFQKSNGSSNSVWDLKKRFLFLLDFCREYQLSTSRQELAYQWLLAGFLPTQGPDEYSSKAETIPDAAELIAGNPECRSQRETRFWQIPHRNRICYLAYNRSYALNRPAAIWQTGRSGYINGD